MWALRFTPRIELILIQLVCLSRIDFLILLLGELGWCISQTAVLRERAVKNLSLPVFFTLPIKQSGTCGSAPTGFGFAPVSGPGWTPRPRPWSHVIIPVRPGSRWPSIGVYDARSRAHHPRAERRHRDVFGPGFGASDGFVVARPRYGQRPHAVRAHIATCHWPPSLGSQPFAHTERYCIGGAIGKLRKRIWSFLRGLTRYRQFRAVST